MQPAFTQLDSDYIFSLWAFFALAYFELHALTFGQSLEAFALNGAEMNEYIRTIVLLDEAEALGFVEKLNLAGDDL